MSIRSDHKALIFVSAVAILGAGVRVARAIGAPADRQAQPALEHQMQAADSAKRAGGKRRPKSLAKAQGSAASVAGIAAPRPKLDVDLATAAQLDSLPGMTRTVAKRIVADRMLHGPFTNLGRLSRVKGVTTKLLQRIDTLVVFSGTIAPINPADTVIPPAKRPGSK